MFKCFRESAWEVFLFFSGLVSKIFPPDQLLNETIKLGEKIASHSPIIVALCKESVNTAYETTLKQGLVFEKRTFYATFATVSVILFLIMNFRISGCQENLESQGTSDNSKK